MTLAVSFLIGLTISTFLGLIISQCLGFIKTLLGNFFYDAFAIETNFYDMVNTGVLNINSLYHAIYIFAISILIMMFVKKMIETYFAWSNGDPDNSPLQVVIGFVEALIIMISFGFLYETFVNVLNGFYTSITNAGFGANSNFASIIGEYDVNTYLMNTIGLCIYSIIALQYVLIYFQNLSRGIEILILRFGIPFACIGLLNADKGAFKGYMQQFVKVAFTVIVQLTLLRLSITLLVNAHGIIALATSSLAMKTPGLLSQFLTTYGGTEGKAGKVVHNLSVVGSLMKKH